MEAFLLIPRTEFDALVQELTDIKKRLARLEKGLKQWLSTKEACELTGLSERALYDVRKAGKVEYKFAGVKPLYSRTSLEEYNERNTPRKKKTI